MEDRFPFSFGVLRLLLFTAAVGAAFGLARALPELVFAPVLMSGIAISLIVLVARRRDLRRIASLVVAAVIGIATFLGLAAVGVAEELEAMFVAPALIVALLAAVGVHAWLRGSDARPP